MTRSAPLLLLASAMAAALAGCIQLPPAVAEELRPAVPSRFGGPEAPPRPVATPAEDADP